MTGSAEPREGEREDVAFLRRSLVDLDAELAAGDLEPADHRRLADEYTARLAAALRAGAGPESTELASSAEAAAAAGSVAAGARRAAPVGARRAGRGGLARRAAVVVGVLGFAAFSGWLVARSSGTRTPDQVLTGEIRGGVRSQLDGCLEQSTADALAGLKCYDGILAEDPDQVEALTYRAWLLIRTGDERTFSAARASLDRALTADPGYADARVFRAVLGLRSGDAAGAQADLDAFDALDPPVAMRQLVDQFQLRERIAELAASPAPSPSPTDTGGG
ncbi:MAG: hypothetical protein OEY23_08040 [Acidimicrobiia bacterium]|nr:hypothetical protein [Acidimicrobiia bacterium]